MRTLLIIALLLGSVITACNPEEIIPNSISSNYTLEELEVMYLKKYPNALYYVDIYIAGEVELVLKDTTSQDSDRILNFATHMPIPETKTLARFTPTEGLKAILRKGYTIPEDAPYYLADTYVGLIRPGNVALWLDDYEDKYYKK